MNDKYNNQLDQDFFDKAKPFKEVFPDIVAAQKAENLQIKPIGRPKLDKTKKLTSLRLDVDIIDFFKRGGKGWQTRLNNALKDYITKNN